MVAVDIERAIGDVNSAPSELDLAHPKLRQAHFKRAFDRHPEVAGK